jgi:hypothetical protein
MEPHFVAALDVPSLCFDGTPRLDHSAPQSSSACRFSAAASGFLSVRVPCWAVVVAAIRCAKPPVQRTGPRREGQDYGISRWQDIQRRKLTTFLPPSHINMRDEIAARPPFTAGVRVRSAWLGLASVTFFSDPGQCQFSSCEQLPNHRKHWSEKQ